MAWTNVSKPTGANWTDVLKPAESSVLTFDNDGQPFGLLIAITKDTQHTSVISGWTGISAPTSSVWTLVTKPTT